jgi:hypothetical protein
MINDMPQETTGAKRPAEQAEDQVEKFLAEEKQLESHRHDLIKDLLRQKDAAIKAFDEKLEKLGYDGEHTSKRSHHKDAADKKAE